VLDPRLLKNRLDLLLVIVARPLHFREAFTEENKQRHGDHDMKSTTMKSATMKSGLKTKSAIKAGGLTGINHTRYGLKTKSAIKAGGLAMVNHNSAGLKVRSAVKV
jgi:hypothetical protein